MVKKCFKSVIFCQFYKYRILERSFVDQILFNRSQKGLLFGFIFFAVEGFIFWFILYTIESKWYKKIFYKEYKSGVDNDVSKIRKLIFDLNFV